MTLVPPEEVVPGATGLLGDPNLMAKLEDVAMVQVCFLLFFLNFGATVRRSSLPGTSA